MKSKLFAVLALLLLPTIIYGQTPYIVGSFADRQVADHASLSGNYVSSTDEIPAAANVILLGDIFIAPDHAQLYDLQQKHCKVIRLGGKDSAALAASVKSYSEYLHAGNNPFSDVPPAQTTSNQPLLFPMLAAVELKKPGRQNLNADYVPRPILNSPPPDEPEYVPPILADFAKKGRVALNVNFGPQSSVIPQEAYALLNEVVIMLRSSPDLKILVEGHTDDYMSNDYNLNLSRQRANSIKTWLVDSGVRSDRIRTIGYGESRPVADNSTTAGSYANRRVEIVKD